MLKGRETARQARLIEAQKVGWGTSRTIALLALALGGAQGFRTGFLVDAGFAALSIVAALALISRVRAAATRNGGPTRPGKAAAEAAA